jgi:hypothetical protein
MKARIFGSSAIVLAGVVDPPMLEAVLAKKPSRMGPHCTQLISVPLEDGTTCLYGTIIKEITVHCTEFDGVRS